MNAKTETSVHTQTGTVQHPQAPPVATCYMMLSGFYGRECEESSMGGACVRLFEAQHPRRPNQPRAFRSHSTQAQVTPRPIAFGLE